MSRIVIPIIESVAEDIYARVKKTASWRVSNTFAALSHLAIASLVEVLNAAGASASASLADISLAIAITVMTNIFKRIGGTLSALHP